MKKFLTLEKLNDNRNVAIYSPKFDGEEFNEFEKFLHAFSSQKYKRDIDVILARIEKIEQDGAEDRHFRYESRMNEKIRAIPPNIETSKLRLYCICINERIVILGGGGHKKTRTYQEDPKLNAQVERLKKIHYQLIHLFCDGRTSITNEPALNGDIKFYINE